MATQLAAQHKAFATPDEVRTFPNGGSQLVTVGQTTLARITFERGWHWAEHVRSIAGTESCEVTHTLCILSGRIATRLDSGETFELGAGEVAFIPPGHDGWVVGDEPVVAIEVTGAAEYARRS